MAVKLCPPSFVRYKFCEGTYTTSGFFGSTKISLMYQKPVMRRSSVAFFQLAPPSSERYKPPFFSLASTIKYTRWPRVPGATATPDRPQSAVGSPCPVIGVHVRPSSVDLESPLPGPYDVPFCPGFRMPCHSVAYTTRGLPGSKQRSTAAVTLSLYRTFFHARPPSVVRKTPRSSFGPELCPIAATSTMSGFRGSIRILPICRVSSSPTCCQFFPPSRDL